MIREKIILDLIAEKDVLDVGSVGQTESYNLWNLYQTANCKSLTGIDLPEAEKERKEIFQLDTPQREEQVVFGNMESYAFQREFDVIIAGDVIEHVENQGLFLRNIHRHLRQDGKLVITTPNAKWPTVIQEPNPTHTLWHDRYTLESILDLCGFEISCFRYYYGNKRSYNFFARFLTFRQGLLVICHKKNEEEVLNP